MKRLFTCFVVGALSLSLLTACGRKDNRQEGVSLYPDGWPSETQGDGSTHKPITTATVTMPAALMPARRLAVRSSMRISTRRA